MKRSLLSSLGAALLLCACPEPEPDPAPDGGGTVVARDGGLFLPDPPEEDAGGPPPLCPADDDLEDNDTRADATPLDGETEAVMCGGDDDYFAATADTGCLVSARVAFDPSTGDLDLQLFDPDGTLVDSAAGAGAEATVATTASAAGDYAVRVRGDASAAAAYTLRLVVTCQADLVCPDDDGYEDNDEPLDAVSLADEEVAVGIVCTGDDDYFSLAAPTGCAVDAQLTYDHAAGKDLDLRVVLADESEAQRSLGVTGTERTFTLVEPGSSPVVRINGFGGSFTDNTYRLVLRRVCASDLSCDRPDPNEPNDEATDAARIYPGAGALGQLCGAEEDWYRLSTTAGCTYDVALDFDHEAGNLDLQAEKTDGTVVGTAVSADDDEELSFVADATVFRLRVFSLAADVTNTFRLSVTETCP